MTSKKATLPGPFRPRGAGVMLWIHDIRSHHLETMVETRRFVGICSRNIRNLGFLGGAKWILAIHSKTCPLSCSGSLTLHVSPTLLVETICAVKHTRAVLRNSHSGSVRRVKHKPRLGQKAGCPSSVRAVCFVTPNHYPHRVHLSLKWH